MKKYLFALILFFTVAISVSAQSSQKSWQVGIGLGEMPIDGSFKPSFSLGYHFNEKIYSGAIFQIRDKISRDKSSFNAQASGLDGLLDSSEKVGYRFIYQIRYTLFRRGPYLSGGIVFNAEDVETMVFDDQQRTISDKTYSGTIQIIQSRPSGWGVALGIGYQYEMKNGISVGFEWTPAWGQYATPSYKFGGTASIDLEAQQDLTKKMNKKFKSTVTNTYKIFHIGIAYRFQS